MIIRNMRRCLVHLVKESDGSRHKVLYHNGIGDSVEEIMDNEDFMLWLLMEMHWVSKKDLADRKKLALEMIKKNIYRVVKVELMEPHTTCIQH